MKTSAKYVVVMDFETGGLPNANNKAFTDVAMCEVAVCVVDMMSLSIIEEYSSLIAPNYKDNLIYSEQAFSVTGLSIDILEKEGKLCKDVYKELKAILKKYKNVRQGATVLGHNYVQYDKPFLENMFKFFDDNIDEYVTFWDDTMKLAHWSELEQLNYKLGTCCETNGVNLVNAHRALADTRSNAELFIEYVKRLRGKGNSVGSGEVKEEETFVFQIPQY